MEKKILKFRAWDGRLMYNDLAFIGGNGNNICMSRNPDMPVIRPIIMQFTGLLDKNNKEIYEGDIIFSYGNEQRYRVLFGGYSAEQWDVDEYEHIGFYVSRLNAPKVCEGMGNAKEWAEIIGNIYENPELLFLDTTKIR